MTPRSYAAAQLTGTRSHQCDATAVRTVDGVRAYALLDGIGSSDEVRDWTRTMARRLADAADIKYIGDPAIEDSGVSNVQDLAEGRWMVWYQEHWRHRTVYILRVQHLGD